MEPLPLPSSTRRRYACRKCDATFLLKTLLKIHDNVEHLKLKRYECEHCGKSFTTQKRQRQHERRVHGQSGRTFNDGKIWKTRNPTRRKSSDDNTNEENSKNGVTGLADGNDHKTTSDGNNDHETSSLSDGNDHKTSSISDGNDHETTEEGKDHKRARKASLSAQQRPSHLSSALSGNLEKLSSFSNEHKTTEEEENDHKTTTDEGNEHDTAHTDIAVKDCTFEQSVNGGFQITTESQILDEEFDDDDDEDDKEENTVKPESTNNAETEAGSSSSSSSSSPPSYREVKMSEIVQLEAYHPITRMSTDDFNSLDALQTISYYRIFVEQLVRFNYISGLAAGDKLDSNSLGGGMYSSHPPFGVDWKNKGTRPDFYPQWLCWKSPAIVPSGMTDRQWNVALKDAFSHMHGKELKEIKDGRKPERVCRIAMKNSANGSVIVQDPRKRYKIIPE